jgi:cell division protein FtsI (penicillin-binding protein 3)
MIGVLAFMLMLFAVVAGRLAQLQLLDGGRYTALGESQRIRPVTLPASRGSVFDRNGNDLALSVPQKTVWADPRLVTDAQREAEVLAPVLGIGPDSLLRKLTTKSAFVYLARQVDDATAQKVKDLKLDGIAMLDESKRFNPSGQLARSVVGGVDIDNAGTAGLEQQYDTTLTGTPGELLLEQDPNGRTIAAGEHRLTPAQPGNDLVLTIDQAMQFEVERALGDQIKKMGAKGGMAVVSNPRTGEILAMASMTVPDTTTGIAMPSSDNKAVTAVFEPGSANKIITLAAAMEEGIAQPATVLTVPDHMSIGGYDFSDHDPHPTQAMTVTDILANSSNIGTIMLGEQLGADRVDSYLHKFGFGAPTSLQFPNESGGLMLPLDGWTGSSIGSIPIGQGVAVTALQMLQAYNVIANGGVYVEPKLVAATIDKSGVRHPTDASATHRVVSTETATKVRDMMVAVVRSGTGKEAGIDGYDVAGKTGTARKPQPKGGYLDEAGHPHYMATFAGFVPAQDPQLSAIVVLDEPTGSIYASDTSAPVFSQVAAYALRRYEIPPPAVRLEPAVPPITVPASGAQNNDVTGGKVQQSPATTSTTTTAPTTTTTTGKGGKSPPKRP